MGGPTCGGPSVSSAWASWRRFCTPWRSRRFPRGTFPEPARRSPSLGPWGPGRGASRRTSGASASTSATRSPARTAPSLGSTYSCSTTSTTSPTRARPRRGGRNGGKPSAPTSSREPGTPRTSPSTKSPAHRRKGTAATSFAAAGGSAATPRWPAGSAAENAATALSRPFGGRQKRQAPRRWSSCAIPSGRSSPSRGTSARGIAATCPRRSSKSSPRSWGRRRRQKPR
mmetsp:Transcript_20902/g.67327  ORF Transcript_20902/g.67327 Transcript_20902/m.67327 type:complete len:228 (-) Transcript_20902:603-1286(-)